MSLLGFLGFGEAAYHLAAGLRQMGMEKIVAFDIVWAGKKGDPIYETAMEKVDQTGVVALSSAADLAGTADTIVVAVPGMANEAAATDLITALSAGQLLVDVTSASPHVKERLGRLCDQKGILYADSPMLGPLAVDGHKVPMIACGPGAKRWQDEMTAFEMNISLIEGHPGKATQIKLARSIFTKGFEALLVETFLFARKCGIEAIVMDSIGKTMDHASFRQSAQRYMASDLIHAARKAQELADAIEIMHKMGMPPMVGEGAVARLRSIAALNCTEKLGGTVPASLDQIYCTWEECGAI